MKKPFIYIAALTLIAACNKTESPVPSQDSDIIIAQIEQDTATKTYLDAQNNIRWSEDDQIVGFMKSSLGQKYQILPSSVGKTSASFENLSGSNIDSEAEWGHNILYYPYSDAIGAAKNGSAYTLNVVLPDQQTYAAESFGKGSMAMAAVSEDNNMTFKNVLGAMKLQFLGTQRVKSIALQGRNNEKLSGDAVVTAYTDDTKPAITMASGASKSVTLNCAEGVQLNESTATDFIIALPPVLFSKGFTVTVTDAEGQTYTVGTDKANVVQRSSILSMPAFRLGEDPDSSLPENSVDMIVFDIAKLTVVTGATYAPTVGFDPSDAPDKTLAWNSSDASVASVDASGVIKALSDGTATITAVAVGGATASCTVTVKSCTTTPSVDYVADGVNHGKGIAIGDVVWAPVNCGYEAPTDDYKGYPYGKLYQWGRKYGQDYSGNSVVQGPVMVTEGQAEENKDKFFSNSESPRDWCATQMDDLWNSGSEASPLKSKYDPCPKGWRVPTYAELDKLSENYSSNTSFGDQKGRYFSGEYTCLECAPRVFLPAAGCTDYSGYGRFTGYARGSGGLYWSSGAAGNQSYCLIFYLASLSVTRDPRANAFSVRCVQE